ncbi:MAG: hypothetical protein GY858_00185 [Candidatus Omnitrophica bacterium]|nr:hypothetical protein [Candidatus Omnitrophota bacterium]
MIQNPVLSLGIIFILGFLLSRLVKKAKIPAITAYVALGVLLSPNLLNLVSPDLLAGSDFFSNIVLGMIAFSLGENLSSRVFKQVGRAVTGISILAAIIPCLLITVIFWLVFKQPFYIALVVGAIASATDPATSVVVTQEYKSKGEFTDTLLGIVAVDDAWALILFGLSLSIASAFTSSGDVASGVVASLVKSCIEIGLSFMVGMLVAVLFDKFTGFINTVKDRLIYTLGFLFLVIGITSSLNFSVLLSCMFFGAVLSNTNNTSFEFFGSLREIDAPLYLIFFVLAGAHLNVAILTQALFVTIALITLRAIGKILGSLCGAKIVSAPDSVKKYMGLALLPQAGVALGCALIAKHTLNNSWGDWILNITIASTVVFELVGPWITKFVLVKVGDIKE